MSSQKYLCMYRGAPTHNKPSPAQMQEMFAAFNGWKEKFKANILDMGSKLKSSGKVVTADVPLAEMFQYSTAMRSMSQGRATFHMDFSHYEDVPQSIAATLVEAGGGGS